MAHAFCNHCTGFASRICARVQRFWVWQRREVYVSGSNGSGNSRQQAFRRHLHGTTWPQRWPNSLHADKWRRWCMKILDYIILNHTILYYTILYYTILYYTILYYTILYYTILYYDYHIMALWWLHCMTTWILWLAIQGCRCFRAPWCALDMGRQILAAARLWMHVPTYRKAPCSCMVYTWAFKGLSYHDFGIYVCTVKLHGAFGLDAQKRL